jgi:hypothetical protein
MKTPNACGISCMLFFFLPVFCKAQTGLSPHGGSGSLGLARAFICMPGLPGVFGNPANLSQLQGFEAELCLEERFQGAGLRETSFGFGAHLPIGSLGLGFRQLGASAYREQLLQLSYARKLTPGLNIGVRFDAGALGLEAYDSQVMINASLGMTAALSSKVATGFFIHHPFRPDAPNTSFMLSAMGVGLYYMPVERFRLVADIFKYAMQPPATRVGIEYRPAPAFQIRVGASVAPYAFSFGLGMDIPGGVRLQVSSSQHAHLGFSPAIGLQYRGAFSNMLSTSP